MTSKGWAELMDQRKRTLDMKLKTLLPTLALVVMAGLAAAPLSAQTTGTTNLALNLNVAGTLSVNNSASTINLTGPTFGPWASTAGATQVNFSYRAGSTSTSGVSITVTSSNGADAMVGSNAANVIPDADMTLTTSGAVSSGTLVGSTALASAGATLFTNAASTHAQNQQFNITYSVSSGNFAADTYTTTLTYTLAVS